MEKEFIPYKQALELKELGFDEPCFGIYYTKDGDIRKLDINEIGNAPLYQQAFRWFRQVHKVYHRINMFGDWDNPQYSYIVLGRNMDNPTHMWYYENKNSYEEAELACLNKLIKLVLYDLKKNQ